MSAYITEYPSTLTKTKEKVSRTEPQPQYGKRLPQKAPRRLTSPLARRIQGPSRLNRSLDLCLREDLTIRNDDALLAGVISHRTNASSRSSIPVIHSTHGNIGGVRDLGEAGSVAPSSTGAGPGAVVFPPAAVLANEAGYEARGDGFEGWDGGGEDADVGFDYGPVHRAADGVGKVCRAEHCGDVGDSDDGGDAGTRGLFVRMEVWMGIGELTRDPGRE